MCGLAEIPVALFFFGHRATPSGFMYYFKDFLETGLFVFSFLV